MQIVCCVCHRVKLNNRWVKMEVDLGEASHGYCPECYGRTLAIIRRMNGAALEKRATVAAV